MHKHVDIDFAVVEMAFHGEVARQRGHIAGVLYLVGDLVQSRADFIWVAPGVDHALERAGIVVDRAQGLLDIVGEGAGHLADDGHKPRVIRRGREQRRPGRGLLILDDRVARTRVVDATKDEAGLASPTNR